MKTLHCVYINNNNNIITCFSTRKLFRHEHLFKFQTDEDVVFVSERSASKAKNIPIDLIRLLALQRDIDEQSQPKLPGKASISQWISGPSETQMEGETKEENTTKDKKHKKEKLLSPEIKNCSAEDWSQAKRKKGNKRKKIETMANEEEEETDQKKKKKKLKRNKDDSSHLPAVMDKDKKKKKLVESNVIEAENVFIEDEKLEKKTRKENKLKDKPVKLKPEDINEEEDEKIQTVNNSSNKPKEKKKAKLLLSTTENAKEMVEEKKRKTADIDGVGETKAKKNLKMEIGTNIERLETEVGKVKLKKNKPKSSKTEGFGNVFQETEKKEKKKKDKLLNEDTVLLEEETTVKITKKKDKKAKEVDEISEVQKVKKKKKLKVDENEVVKDPQSREYDDSQGKKIKKDKNSVKEHQDINTESTGKKKKKVKEELKDIDDSPQEDVVFISAKNGNADEVSINQERRKALQIEIDAASRPHKPDKPTGLGQWSTAQFNSSQQQQKFLRLMGGFKSFQAAGSTAGGANMALGKDAQQHLQQGLLGEFERAHTRRMDFSNKGAGLGFTAPSNKKFSIDVNASRSIRFDD